MALRRIVRAIGEVLKEPPRLPPQRPDETSFLEIVADSQRLPDPTKITMNSQLKKDLGLDEDDLAEIRDSTEDVYGYLPNFKGKGITTVRDLYDRTVEAYNRITSSKKVKV